MNSSREQHPQLGHVPHDCDMQVTRQLVLRRFYLHTYHEISITVQNKSENLFYSSHVNNRFRSQAVSVGWPPLGLAAPDPLLCVAVLASVP